MIDRQWRISLHESSHAVVARVLKLPRCGAATVIEPHAHAQFPCDCGKASICALFAGSAAELALLGGYDEAGAAYDMGKAKYWVQRLGCDGDALWDQTMSLVRGHRPAIEFLAGLLRRARTLDGAAIDKVVGR